MIEALLQIPEVLFTVILPFLVVLGVVVSVHEYGHYIVGRWCGIHAEVFSIGFGREVWGRTDSRGTRWRLAPIPLGGYVKFLGDADASSRVDTTLMEGMSAQDRDRSFPGAALWKRALTVAAGPFANFILSTLIFAGLAIVVGMGRDEPVIGAVHDTPGYILPFQAGDRIIAVNGEAVDTFTGVFEVYREQGLAENAVLVDRAGDRLTLTTGPLTPAVVGGVAASMPADKAGVMSGDVITAINDRPVAQFSDLQSIVKDNGAAELTLTIDRAGAEKRITLTPMMSPVEGADGHEIRPLIGITAMTLISPELRTPGPLEALWHGVLRTWGVIDSSLAFIGALIFGQADPDALGGPIKIATLSGDAAEAGFGAFVVMIALISTSIGMINLFPIPVLDGGHLLFYAIEAVRGKPLGNRFVEMATGLGLGLVLLLMVLVTYNDIAGL